MRLHSFGLIYKNDSRALRMDSLLEQESPMGILTGRSDPPHP